MFEKFHSRLCFYINHDFLQFHLPSYRMYTVILERKVLSSLFLNELNIKNFSFCLNFYEKLYSARMDDSPCILFCFFLINIIKTIRASCYTTPLKPVHPGQIYMAVCFCYLLKICLFMVRYCKNVRWTNHFFQGTRNTRPCITGHPVHP